MKSDLLLVGDYVMLVFSSCVKQLVMHGSARKKKDLDRKVSRSTPRRMYFASVGSSVSVPPSRFLRFSR